MSPKDLHSANSPAQRQNQKSWTEPRKPKLPAYLLKRRISWLWVGMSGVVMGGGLDVRYFKTQDEVSCHIPLFLFKNWLVSFPAFWSIFHITDLFFFFSTNILSFGWNPPFLGSVHDSLFWFCHNSLLCLNILKLVPESCKSLETCGKEAQEGGDMCLLRADSWCAGKQRSIVKLIKQLPPN